jgi:subtilisin family serine protease
MGQVFDSQFQAMYAALASQGTFIEVAYAPNGRPDYLYEAGRLLVAAAAIPLVQSVLPWVEQPDLQPDTPAIRVLSIENRTAATRGVQVTVPQALDLIDARLGDDNPALHGGFPVATPVHIMHITPNGASPDTARSCPATEPEVPGRWSRDEAVGPWPPAAPDGGAGVLIGVCDTGLLADIASAGWLGGVTGEEDDLGLRLPNGLYDIPKYCGHGTFIAGVARCQAPESAVYVANDYVSGGLQEWLVVQQLQQLLGRDPAPQVVNLSAGSYTRNNWLPLSFSAFDAGGVTLVCAAGNDATHRKFWPAAFDWAVAVGALGADQRNRAWFSNYGDWVDVYAPGEGLVNAFATGSYTYREPPKRPAVQVFDGLARWSGTSFAAPLVAGLVAAAMSAGGRAAADATQAVLAQAQAQAVPGVGPVLYPR